MSKNETPTKVIVSCRFSYLHCWEPEAINGGEPKYSVSAIIPKSDKETIKKIQAAVEAAKQESLSKWGGKIPPNLKLPLRDGDIDRPEDEAYKGCYFFNANSRQAPQVVDKQVQPILDQTEVYSGCYGRISVNFYGYCIRDVDVEKGIRQKLHKFPIPESEMAFYRLDQEINDRGVLVDRELVEQSITCDLLHKDIVTNRAYEVTGLENPNSVSQLKGWLSERGVEIDSLSKGAVAELIEDADGEVLEALKLRLLMAKTSVKKYEAIERSVCSDGRVHGLLQFYGANRTGRWAGRLVQVQNLPQNHISDLELARSLVRRGQFEELELFYESTPNVLSELIRTAFIPKEGCRFIVADFSAIEARVLAWLSGEQWRLDVFATHGKIYEASASAMFGVPIEEITKGSPLRQKGKIAELALGYGGAVGALTSMGALAMGLSEDELPGLVSTWRNANPHITQFWWDVDEAAVRAVRERKETQVGLIRFQYASGILFAMLPSGRKLAYVKPRMGVNKYGRDGLTYEGVGENKKWERMDTYGPKLVENIVQGTSRDILAEAMMRLNKAGFSIVFHVHDEAVLEVPEGKSSVEEVCRIMAEPPSWVHGLPLRADGYECQFYKKD